MAAGPDLTGTEGERLDATVTVNSTFSSQQTQTIGLRVEDGGTVVHTDTQDVTLADSTDSQQITLSWPTSDGDAGVYDLFLESDQDTIQRLVEVTDTRIVDTFEDGDLSEYNNVGDNNKSWSTTTNTAFEGSVAAVSEGGSADHTIHSAQGDGLNYYPQGGDTVELHLQCQSKSSAIKTQFLADTNSGPSSSGYGTAYEFEYRPRSNGLVLQDKSAGGGSDSVSVTPPINEWIRVTLDFDTGGAVTATVESTSSNFSETLSIPYSSQHGRALAFSSDNADFGIPPNLVDKVRTI